MIDVTKQSEKAKKAQAEYLKAWRAKNGDKMKEYRRRYWEKKALEQEVKNDDDNVETGD